MLNAYGVARDITKCLRNEAVTCFKLQGLGGDFDVLNTGTRSRLYTHSSELALEASCEQQQVKVKSEDQCSSHGITGRYLHDLV
jgi:hypothetical protein